MPKCAPTGTNQQLLYIEEANGIPAIATHEKTGFTYLPTNIKWTDVHKDLYFVNFTSNYISFALGWWYIDLDGNTANSLPPHSAVHISKSNQGYWAQVNNNPSNSEISNSSVSTPSIYFSLSGLLNRVISANVNISQQVGNILQIVGDGLFVQNSSGSNSGGRESFSAEEGQTNFITSEALPIEEYKITVFRNGVQVDFTHSVNTVVLFEAANESDIITIQWYN